MNRFLTLILLLSASHSSMLKAQEPAYKNQSIRTYKKIDSGHMTLLFSGITVPEARMLIESGERFYKYLEAEWTIKLENPHIKITISAQAWEKEIQSAYNRSSKTGTIRIRSFEEDQAIMHMQRALTLCLLNQNDTSLPIFFQDGISSYFADIQPPDRDLLTTYAFLRHPKIGHFLQSSDANLNDPTSYEVLSHLFVDRLWRHERANFIKFLQLLLKGNNADTAISQSGLGSNASIMKDFVIWAEAKYRLSRMPLLPDFWKLIFVFVSFIFVLVHFWRSWKYSGLTPEVLDTQSPETIKLMNGFSGPAFESPQEPEPQTDHLRTMHPVESDSPDIQENTSTVHMARLDVSPLVKHVTNKPLFTDPPPIITEEKEMEKAASAIETDLDQFFNLKQKKKPPIKATEDNFKDVDDQIDHLFDL